MKVLITGHKGFIGSNLYSLLSRFPTYELFTLDRNQDVEKVINIVKPDTIVHLAANPLVKLPIDKLINDNLLLTQKIMGVIGKDTHMIFASSATVYGNISKLVEKSGYDGTIYRSGEDSPTVPSSTYGNLKLACEAIIKAYGKPYTILRLVANVGANATHGMLPDLCRKYDTEDIIRPFGDFPGSIKPYMHVKDTAKAIKHIIDRQLLGTYNVSPNDNISILNVLNLIAKDRKIVKPIVWDTPTWAGDDYYVSVDGSKLRRTGCIPKYETSEEAINAAIKR